MNTIEEKQNKLYYIAWCSLITGATGQGTRAFPYEQAVKIRDRANKEYKNTLNHHLIAAKQEESK